MSHNNLGLFESIFTDFQNNFFKKERNICSVDLAALL